LDDTIYANGFARILTLYERRQRPFIDPLDVLPAADVDLNALAAQSVGDDHFTADLPDRYAALTKYQSLLEEFQGQSELWAVHAMCISLLRRNSPPPEAIALFHRIWREKGADLARELPVRWLISAASTFADHGENADLRAGGMGLYMLFDLIKLHASERRLSARRNDRAFQARPERPFRDTLAFDMEPYSLAKGDLDRTMLARLWQICEREPVLHPLGTRMLRLVLTDRRSVFARVQSFKKRRKPEART
jgi:hypothetical protein